MYAHMVLCKQTVGPSPTGCTWTAPDGVSTYDLTALSLQDWPGSDSSYTYKLRVCGVVNDSVCVAKPPAMYGSSVCQYGNAAPFGYIHMLSSWIGSPLPSWSLFNPAGTTQTARHP